jgi:hypothetical protein
MYDSTTHYVVYEIFPKLVQPQPRSTVDQFGSHGLAVVQSEFLMVPCIKISPVPSLTNWGLIILVALLLLTGFIVIRHRRRGEVRA